jgi:hypothetical protein
MDLTSGNNIIPLYTSNWIHDLSGATTWYMNGLSISQDATNMDLWHSSVDFRTANGGLIYAGDIVHFGVSFRLENSITLRPRLAWWTLDGVFVCPARLIGFHSWEPFPAYPVITIYNDTAEQINLAQLEFAVTAIEIPLADMYTIGLGDPGKPGQYPEIKWTPINDPIKIDPGKSIDIDLKAIGIIAKENEHVQCRTYVNEIPQWFQYQQ